MTTGRTRASSAQPGFAPAGAVDGHRFSTEPGDAWKGQPGEAAWWWEIHFDTPRDVGAILQVQGDLPERLQNAPRRYVWQSSRDGTTWDDLPETVTAHERRTFRLHRLTRPARAAALRLKIEGCAGEFPTLREVEFYEAPDTKVSFDDWIVVVSTLEEERWPGAGDAFIPLARSCPGWEHLQAQHVWLDSFDEAFVAAEPRPLCAFLSGNFRDWCEVPRHAWRGTQEVLTTGNLPMWGACGGAQGLAILAEAGVDREWDCPHCRDPKNPKLPIYTHIGHSDHPPPASDQRPPTEPVDPTDPTDLAAGRHPTPDTRHPTTAGRRCGEYSACDYERGRYNVLQVRHDPAFAGLTRQFEIMESHCGQIEWPPDGWMLVVTAGEGAKTKTQCIRVKDRYIYAAQFHIEMDGTPENSLQIMSNFLGLAKAWGGYNPEGKAVATSPDWPGAG